MKSVKDPRHKARMKLVEVLYSRRLNPETQDLSDDIFKYDKELYSQINDVIYSHENELDALIIKTAKRESHDIKNIEYIILEIALAESFYSQITPYKVAIDEAIELAREYGDEASSTFVSGVLGAAFEELKDIK